MSRRCHSPVIDPPLPSPLIGTSKRRSLDKEDASKHGRNLNARLIYKEDEFNDGFDVVRDEGITHVEGDAEQVVIAAAEVVNAGLSVSTAEPKTPLTTTTTTLLENDKVIVAATLVQMSETSKVNSIVFEDVEELYYGTKRRPKLQWL
ncbi:hypothetical protein Tco_0373411 [Tanacetum coccineum]